MYKEETMKRENLWKIGLVMIALGIAILSLFIASTEELYFFSQLNQFVIGFFVSGLILLVFGFLFTITCLDQRETSENRKKIREVVTLVTIFFLILIGYLMVLDHDHEWEVKGFIIEDFADQMFGFYPPFTLTSFDVLFTTLFGFGILILPFAIGELGILDDHPNVPIEDLKKEGQKIKEREDQLDRFVAFLKRQFNLIKRIKNYILPIGITSIIFGFCFIGIPPLLLIDSPPVQDKKGIYFIKDYKGFIRGQLLLLGILMIVIGFILIRHYIRRRR